MQIESRLEEIIEGVFGKEVGVESIIRAVAHAFEDAAADDAARQTPVTPQLTIQLHPLDYGAVITSYPYFDRQLVAYVVELAREQGIALHQEPGVTLVKTSEQQRGTVGVMVSSSAGEHNSTEQMERVPVDDMKNPVRIAQLIRDGKVIVQLERHIMNIGRQFDNHLVLEDNRVSRHHCQIRLRNGRFMIYDLNSTHGTFVNSTPVSETVLQHGDVISLGGVNLLYVEDSTEASHTSAGDTSIRPPQGWIADDYDFDDDQDQDDDEIPQI